MAAVVSLCSAGTSFYTLVVEHCYYTGIRMENLNALIEELWALTGTDFEGDCTYRVHVKKSGRADKKGL